MTIEAVPYTELCPRCEINRFTPRGVPVSEVGETHIRLFPYPALSRVVDRDICSPCGQDEAMRDFTGAGPVPPYEWPLTAPGYGRVEEDDGA